MLQFVCISSHMQILCGHELCILSGVHSVVQANCSMFLSSFYGLLVGCIGACRYLLF